MLIPMLYNSDEQARWDVALAFAKQAHGSQVRKYTGEPYWHHLVNVASTVSQVAGRPIEAIEAALLHDVLEDTPVTVSELQRTFVDSTARYVIWMTDPPLAFGNRKRRKAATLDRLRQAPDIVKTIKLADTLDNSSSIFANDPNFARVFAKEKVELLEVLRGGDAGLWMRANKVVREYMRGECV